MNSNDKVKIILASKSPRRRELLSSLGYSFSVVSRETDESTPDTLTVQERVRVLAERKAQAVASDETADCVIIGSDTLLEFEGQPLGKPKDEEDARKMLASLSGVSHKVHTSIALIYGDKTLVSSDVTTVNMRPYTKEEIDYYVSTGDPMDKAGSYGIQSKGGFLVASIDGELDTVIGFPTRLFSQMLSEILK
jgi:septum formation protein